MNEPTRYCTGCGNMYYGFTGNRDKCDRCGEELLIFTVYELYKQTKILETLEGLQKQVLNAVEQLPINKGDVLN